MYIYIFIYTAKWRQRVGKKKNVYSFTREMTELDVHISGVDVIKLGLTLSYICIYTYINIYKRG